MAHHGREADVDLALLAPTDLVDGRLHVVVDAPPRHAAQHPESVVVGVEQHLVSLQQVGSQREGTAVGQLDVGDLQLGALAGDDRPILRPVELESLARHKGQRHEGAAAAGLLLAQPGGLPVPGKGRHPIVRPLIAQRHQIGVQLFDRALVLARLAGLDPQHRRELVGIGIELARALGDLKPRFDAIRPQVLAHGVPREAGAAGYLPDLEMVPVVPAPDDAQ